MRVALATCAALPEPDLDQEIVSTTLSRHGIDAELCVWNDPEVDWAAFDLCLLRTTWDYYRDRDAAEADLIIEHPGRLTLVEAKSAQTASASLFSGAKRVRGHLDDPSRPCDVILAYGGEEAQRRTDARLVPWADLHDVKWIA